jgi:hypothetical protein
MNGCLIEWPKEEQEPTKYWLSTLPPDIGLARMIDLATLRWRIERDYQELKQEVGLGHFEGRGWRSFHHHASLCIAAYGFLISERETIPPSAPRSFARFQAPRLPRRLSTPRRCRSELSVTFPTPSPPCDEDWLQLSFANSHDVRAAPEQSCQRGGAAVYNAARLERDDFLSAQAQLERGPEALAQVSRDKVISL